MLHAVLPSLKLKLNNGSYEYDHWYSNFEDEKLEKRVARRVSYSLRLF